jgi:hypothetical protein
VTDDRDRSSAPVWLAWLGADAVRHVCAPQLMVPPLGGQICQPPAHFSAPAKSCTALTPAGPSRCIHGGRRSHRL